MPKFERYRGIGSFGTNSAHRHSALKALLERGQLAHIRHAWFVIDVINHRRRCTQAAWRASILPGCPSGQTTTYARRRPVNSEQRAPSAKRLRYRPSPCVRLISQELRVRRTKQRTPCSYTQDRNWSRRLFKSNQAVREAARYAPAPVRRMLRPSSSPYTPYAWPALASSSCGRHEYSRRTRQTDRRQTRIIA